MIDQHPTGSPPEGDTGHPDPTPQSLTVDRDTPREASAATPAVLGPQAASPPTQPTDAFPSGRPDPACLPVAPTGWPLGWDRYHCLGILGSGGMGRVYEAYDPALRRRVAIKLLHGEDPEIERRFLREAQAQARVDHPHICKVFEVGEAGGRPYIAMQLVTGKPLSRACGDLSVEQKALLVQQVAEALHAAHKVGLVHRDLKPGNIMVERTDSGAIHPFVVDFGLVRELGAESLTIEGAAIGTPSFMAPEQAGGEAHRIDRRTDVYALGATLYAILRGQPPFTGTTPVDVLRKVLDEDPPSLSSVAPDVPDDLATIVMKCLEKEPARRYDSARALAEDLRRFLDGEPILARPASVIYRLGKRARKNRLAFGLGTAALLATLILGGLWLLARRDAGRRAELAQRFGQQVERAESDLWKAFTLEPHDIRPDHQLLKATLQAIETEMGRLGRLAEGPGHAAIGRCHLALLDYPRARQHLERAWSLGFRPPEVAADLGSALTWLYVAGLRDLRTIGDRDRRKTRKDELGRELRTPARRFLVEASGAPGGGDAYARALVAFLDGDAEAAMRLARATLELCRWRYEAFLLIASVLVEEGDASRDAGLHEDALLFYARSEAALRRAARTAPSDPRIWEGICNAWRLDLHTRIWSMGSAEPEHYRRVILACNAAAMVDPASASPLVNLAEAHTSWADLLQRQGADALDAIQAAIAATDGVLSLDPGHPVALARKSTALWQLGKRQYDRGQDPSATFEEGLALDRRAEASQPANSRLHLDHGLLALDLGLVRFQNGQDPVPALSEAAEAFSMAAELEPRQASPLINLGMTLGVLLDHEIEAGTGTPAQTADRALAALQRAEALNAKLHWIPRSKASVYLALGRLASRRNEDPRPHLAASAEAARQAMARNPNDPVCHNYLSHALLAQARYELDHGLPAAATLQAAAETIRQGLGVNPAFPDLLQKQREVRQLEARWRAARRAAPTNRR